MSSTTDRSAVIVGVGAISDRPADPAQGMEPVDLAAAALRRAEADAGVSLLAHVDSLDVVGVVSWPYDDLPALLAERIGARPARRQHGPIGGQTPVQFIHEAAQRIARGESEIAAICGAESSHTVTMAKRHGITLPWTPPPARPDAQTDGWLPRRNRDYLHPLAREHGITEPITVYPLYEVATASAWQQTAAEARAESATLWSGLSHRAAAYEDAWLHDPLPPEAIASVSPSNRPIAFPYTKLMVANPAVNQGAALLVTSLAKARALGLAEHRLIHIGAGASAAEPLDWCSRDRLDHAPGQEAVLDAMLQAAQDANAAFGVVELYSCFPVVPKMARRRLGRTRDASISEAGGLTFHGAPLNNYMTHGAVACVRALRQRDTLGLLYGQGGALTQHYGLVLGRTPTQRASLPATRQAEADQRRFPPPPIVRADSGAATIETFTIVYGRDGTAEHGTVVLRTTAGDRTLARVDPADGGTLAALAEAADPIGLLGRLRPGADGLARWTAT